MGEREPLSLFGMMVPTQTEAGPVEYQELHAAGLTINDAKPAYIIVCFQGHMIGMNVPDGMVVEHKILMDGQNAALLAAIVIAHGETVAGRVPFTAWLDQQLSYVRGKIKENGETTP